MIKIISAALLFCGFSQPAISQDLDSITIFPKCAYSWLPPKELKIKATGKTKEGTAMVLYLSTDGHWGLLEVNPDGLQCLLATGDKWEQAK